MAGGLPCHPPTHPEHWHWAEGPGHARASLASMAKLNSQGRAGSRLPSTILPSFPHAFSSSPRREGAAAAKLPTKTQRYEDERCEAIASPSCHSTPLSNRLRTTCWDTPSVRGYPHTQPLPRLPCTDPGCDQRRRQRDALIPGEAGPATRPSVCGTTWRKDHWSRSCSHGGCTGWSCEHLAAVVQAGGTPSPGLGTNPPTALGPGCSDRTPAASPGPQDYP